MSATYGAGMALDKGDLLAVSEVDAAFDRHLQMFVFK
jgi:hypothetical protein